MLLIYFDWRFEMKDLLREYLCCYKAASLKIINDLNSDNIDAIGDFLTIRENMLSRIRTLEYTKEQINSLCDELHILQLDRQVNNLIINKQEELKNRIEKASVLKNANNSYNNNLYRNSMIFSKKI